MAKVEKVTSKGVVMVGNKVALLRKPCGQWDLPGGGIHDGDSPEDTLIRETQEEMGLKVRIQKPLRSFYIVNRHGQTNFCITFLCEARKSSEIKLGDEHVEVRLFNPNKLPDDDFPIQYLDSIGVALGKKPGKLPQPKPEPHIPSNLRSVCKMAMP